MDGVTDFGKSSTQKAGFLKTKAHKTVKARQGGIAGRDAQQTEQGQNKRQDQEQNNRPWKMSRETAIMECDKATRGLMQQGSAPV